MKEKTQSEIAAAERQVELISNALQAASREGYWLNPSGKSLPGVYGRNTALSPFNALIFAIHSDASGYSTSQYTSFPDTRKRGEAVLSGERSVPMLWYNWSKMVSRHNPENAISKEDWQKLAHGEQANYKPLRQREIRALFNIEQTTLPMSDPSNFEALRQSCGSMADRGNIAKEEQAARNSINLMTSNIRENLVPIRKSTTGEAFYDVGKDAVYMPSQKQYASYPEYVQDLMRCLVASTGHGERLARQPIMGGALDSNSSAYEQLVQELASGYALLELGMPAKMKPDNVERVERWINDMRTNPCLIDALEADVNNSLDIIHRAQRGEKIVFASKRNEELADQARKSVRPQVSQEEALIMQDILARGGYAIDYRNFPGHSDAEKKAYKNTFMEKFCNLEYYEGELLHALSQAEKYTKEEPNSELAEVAYTTAGNEASRIYRILSECLPQEWEKRGPHTIADEMMCIPDKRSREFMVIKDSQTGIVDVVLPGCSRQGGEVLMSNGDRRNFWLTPEEVMPADDRKENGATVVRRNLPGFNKDKISSALMADGATYVRFFDKDGLLGYRPDDSYFKGKDLMAAKLNGKEICVTSHFDVTEAVRRASETVFERVQMIKDDNGRWALLLKPENSASYSVLPDSADVNRFFSTLKSGDQAAANLVRNELAQKYHAMASNNASMKMDLFYSDIPDNIDPDRIQRISIFRTKDNKYMIAPVISGIPKTPPRLLNDAQWQRLWVADDVQKYKFGLAAHIFSDLLQKAQNETVEIKQSQDMANESSHGETTSEAQAKDEDVAPKTANEEVGERLRRYEEMKKKHPDALLLFRAGEDYQAFKDDAIKVADVLKLKIKNAQDEQKDRISYVEFSHGNLDTALPKMVRAGHRVAICEELSNPRIQANRWERSDISKPKEETQETQQKGLRM